MLQNDDRNKFAIVTGGSRGIGRAFVNYLLNSGYRVLVISISENSLSKLCFEFSKEYKNADIIPLSIDVGNIKQVQQNLQPLLSQFQSIDLLINNAGVAKKGTIELKPEEFRDLQMVNLIGAYNITYYVAPYMKKQKYGTIINIASISGIMTRKEHGAYCASKSALLAWSNSLKQELLDFGIKVTAISPNLVFTDMTREVTSIANEDFVPVEDVIKTLDYILSLTENSLIENITLHCKSKYEQSRVK